jgi:hypothetical protein
VGVESDCSCSGTVGVESECSCSGTVGVGSKGTERFVVCIAKQDQQERTNEAMRKVLKKELVHDAKRDIGRASVRRKRRVEDT